LLLLWASACGAVLTARDLATNGDRLLVFDSVSGLEWLALGQTYRTPATEVRVLMVRRAAPTDFFASVLDGPASR
jgi:hypothetical protein